MTSIVARFAALTLFVSACGADGTDGNDYPPKPSCDRDDALALMACPAGFEWVAIWEQSSPTDPEVTQGQYLPVDEDPGESWAKIGEVCVAEGQTPSRDNVYSGWTCRDEACSAYGYTIEADDAVRYYAVTCNLTNDSVGLDITTTRPGEEPTTDYWRWYLGAETPEKLDL